MKKLLTVVLVIAVMFTFSFGSAFATSTTEQIANEAAAQKAAMTKKINDEVMTQIVFKQTGEVVTPQGYDKLTKAVVEAEKTKLIAKLTGKIDEAARKQIIAGAYDEGALADAWINDYANINSILDADDTWVAQYEADKAATLAKIAKVDPNAYEDIDRGGVQSDKKKVMAAIKTASDKVAAIAKPTTKATAEAAITTLTNAYNAFKAEVANYTTLADHEKAIAKAKAEAKAAVEKKANTLKAQMKETLITEITNPASTPSQVAAAKAQYDALDSNVAAVLAKYAMMIDQVATSATVTPAQAAQKATDLGNAGVAAFADKGTFEAEVSALGNIDALIAYAQSYAASMKVAVMDDGTVKYNAATVDAQLADVIKMIKAGTLLAAGKVKEELDKTPLAMDEANALKAAKTKAKADLKVAYPEVSYKDAELKEIKALLETADKNIDAAATKAELEAAVKAAKAELDKVLTNDQKTVLDVLILNGAKTLNYALTSDGTGATTGLEGYYNAMVAKNTGKTYAAATKEAVLKKAYKVLADAVYAKKNPNLKQTEVNQILQENYLAALAVIDATMDDASLAAAAAAVDAAIDKIPSATVIDMTSKDVILAAKKAKEDFLNMPGATEAMVKKGATLAVAEAALVKVEHNAISDKVNALNFKVRLGQLTLADAPAVKEAREDLKKAMDTYKEWPGYATLDWNNLDTLLKGMEDKIALMNFQDAANKINSLPAEITLKDKAAVKAACDAFDALTEAQKKALSPALVSKLKAAKNQIETLEMASVEAVKLTARSVRGKGYIKVLWRAEGDTSKVQKYEIWRSTKKNSGFKKYFTTKKMTYKNTKSLKSGKRYYYKVRAIAFTEDGTKIRSDWSNKAYRVAK